MGNSFAFIATAYLNLKEPSQSTFDCALAEIVPTEGTFEGYFFVDRWGQPYFKTFFVSDDLTNEFQSRNWSRFLVKADDIQSHGRGGIITSVQRVRRLPERLMSIQLQLDEHRVSYGDDTQLHVSIENRSQKPIVLHAYQIGLNITVHQRGTRPQRALSPDQIYSNRYWQQIGNRRMLRSTSGAVLGADESEIRMNSFGMPVLYKDNEQLR